MGYQSRKAGWRAGRARAWSRTRRKNRADFEWGEAGI